MDRFETDIQNSTLYLVGADQRIEVGEVAHIIDTLGEVYEIDYGEQQQELPWLDVEDGVLEVDVRETLDEITFDAAFVERVSTASLEQPADERDMPERTARFIELIESIWQPDGTLPN